MFNTIKDYIIAILAVVSSVFLAMFAYRGKKIESLEQDNDTLKENVDTLETVTIEQQKEKELNEEVIKIHSDNYSVSESANWLRERAKNNQGKSK